MLVSAQLRKPIDRSTQHIYLCFFFLSPLNIVQVPEQDDAGGLHHRRLLPPHLPRDAGRRPPGLSDGRRHAEARWAESPEAKPTTGVCWRSTSADDPSSSSSSSHRDLCDRLLLPGGAEGQSQNPGSDFGGPHRRRHRPLRGRFHPDRKETRRRLLKEEEELTAHAAFYWWRAETETLVTPVGRWERMLTFLCFCQSVGVYICNCKGWKSNFCCIMSYKREDVSLGSMNVIFERSLVMFDN